MTQTPKQALYLRAYNRAYRITHAVCRLTGLKRNSDRGRAIYDLVWNRTARETP